MPKTLIKMWVSYYMHPAKVHKTTKYDTQRRLWQDQRSYLSIFKLRINQQLYTFLLNI